MTYVEPLVTGTHAREEFHIFDDFPLPGDDFEDDVTDIFTVTKSGRVANNWRTSWSGIDKLPSTIHEYT